MDYTFDPNNLCYRMIKYFKDRYLDIDSSLRERLIICNEGSSRSSKTWDFYHFLFWLCDLKEIRENPIQIIVVRKTLKNCREIAYDTDFIPCMKLIGHYSPEHERNAGQSPRYNLFGSTIKFKGLDDGEELGKSHVLFFNEALDNDSKKVVDNMLMRCEMLAAFDWNPKLTYHFLFDLEGKKNVLFTKTTFWDNKHLNPTIKADRLSKCPWDFKDFDIETRTWRLPEEERSINIENKKNNTIDRWDWLVYGEGIRCPEDGVIFQDIDWISKFPDNLEEVKFGLDFGYSVDPSVLVKVGRSGFDLYLEYLTYQSCPSPEHLYDLVEPILEKEYEKRKLEAGNLDFEPIIVHCDSADKYKDVEFVVSLNETKCVRNKEFDFVKTRKTGIVVGISAIKKFRLHIVDNGSEITKKSRIEFENYSTKVISGIQTNIPIDGFNHGIDAFRYVVVDNWIYLVR